MSEKRSFSDIAERCSKGIVCGGWDMVRLLAMVQGRKKKSASKRKE